MSLLGALGVGALGKLAGGFLGVSAIPIVGPILAGVWRGLRAVAGWVYEGLIVTFANPAVLTVICGTFLFGVWQGIAWDKHLVEQARVAVSSEEAACDTKLVAIQSELQKSATERLRQVREAVATAPRVETPAEILDLCMRSASCRDSREKR
jgi:hypothetical protein